ncbi:T7SS effector LXG polymorphic toxin [Listeria welshimeri]|uniref:T7SS effector LXG polymorphic toxin n=1 Tax=Listeria welshimeri TaxID=1643 RepID=UPI001888DB06|nr:T7SS effector LXG polymorphic toxin [Listeria welshimeri]MBF2579735.1 LXG domain-containing protein [Listeria welshimeri]MBF2581933.1 LXG domain-containing protein [Listeria welshimeri]MBF2698148.1 LXG domain-containing protein [Listeria welshimeri]
MSRIDIGEIRTFALQLKEANQQGKRCIKAIQTVVTNYAEEDSLKGKAIDASKNYYQMTYVPLCKAILEVMEESQERLRQYMDDFHDQVDSSPNARIDEEGLFELGQQIDRLEAKKETLAQRMNVGTEGQMQIYRSQLSKAYKKENIVEKYLAFEQSHTDFFAHISDLVQNIQQTIRELQSNIQFNHHTGTYDITKLDLDTVSRLQQALGKETNTQPKKFPFNEYQKTYTGTTWILTRGGIIDVEATTAYNEAILHGELPPESNQATEDAELLKGIIASVKAGKDPLTGQEISLLQGISIIAGTTFMYTAGAYHGKRMGIPKLKGVLRRKKTGGGNVPNPDIGVVQSRVNVANGRTRFTPTRPSTRKSVSAGFEHVLDGHFNRPIANSRSVFSVTADKLKQILQSQNVVKATVVEMGGGQYKRIVDTGEIVGNTALKYGGTPTTWIEVITDRAGNLITTYPVPKP